MQKHNYKNRLKSLVIAARGVIHSEPLLNVNVCRNFGLKIHF